MILESTYVDSNFIYQFSKKFKSYCSKLPFFVSFHITRDKCHLLNEDSTETYDYEFDLNKSVTESIHEIRIWMLKYWHPRIYEPEETAPTSSEISDAMRSGADIDTVIYSRNNSKTIWIIDKVIITKDTLLLLKEGEYDFSWVYQINMPSSLFLRNVRGKWSNEEAWNMFKEKSTFLYKSPMKLSINKVNTNEVQQNTY